jgi:hypothetical protein
MRYIGNASIIGIPARDLTEAEVEQFGEDFLLSTGLYEKEPEEPKPSTRKSKTVQADKDKEVTS